MQCVVLPVKQIIAFEAVKQTAGAIFVPTTNDSLKQRIYSHAAMLIAGCANPLFARFANTGSKTGEVTGGRRLHSGQSEISNWAIAIPPSYLGLKRS
jgi:hypothetical protein